MKVILGVDGSQGSFAAVELTGRLLSPDKDELAFYYSPPQIEVHSHPRPDEAIVARARQALSDSVFAAIQERLPTPGEWRIAKIVGEEKAARGLLLAADEWRAELIVVGARGVGAPAALTLGSVGRAVAHHSTVPVLIVRASEKRDPSAPLRVLLACDGGETSRQAAQALHGFTWPEGAEGRVIIVLESLLAGKVPPWLEEKARDSDTEAMAQTWVREHEREKQEARERMLAYRRDLPAIFHDREPIVGEGYPSEQILRTIREERIDLVALGARGLGPVSRLLFGSTSEKLLSGAPCSVLLAPFHEKP